MNKLDNKSFKKSLKWMTTNYMRSNNQWMRKNLWTILTLNSSTNHNMTNNISLKNVHQGIAEALRGQSMCEAVQVVLRMLTD